MSAIISSCGLYRYRLQRSIAAAGPVVMFLMVNPSTADAEQDDPTIRKCMGFARKLGASSMLVGNKFAYRATDVNALRSAPEPVGTENDGYLHAMLMESEIVIAAWGSLNKLPEALRGRWKAVVRLIDNIGRHEIKTIGTCADGHPKHPLMVGYDAPVEAWPVPWFPNRRMSTGDST